MMYGPSEDPGGFLSRLIFEPQSLDVLTLIVPLEPYHLHVKLPINYNIYLNLLMLGQATTAIHPPVNP